MISKEPMFVKMGHKISSYDSTDEVSSVRRVFKRLHTK